MNLNDITSKGSPMSYSAEHALRAHVAAIAQQENDVKQLARNIALLRWAEDQVNLPHDVEIVIPPEFEHLDALAALEQAVVRRYANFPIVKAPPVTWADICLIVTLGLAIALALITFFSMMKWAI